MKKFIVTIEETVVQDFEVMADNAEEASIIAQEKYRKGVFVLEPGECQYRQLAVHPSEEEIEKGVEAEWVKF